MTRQHHHTTPAPTHTQEEETLDMGGVELREADNMEVEKQPPAQPQERADDPRTHHRSRPDTPSETGGGEDEEKTDGEEAEEGEPVEVAQEQARAAKAKAVHTGLQQKAEQRRAKQAEIEAQYAEAEAALAIDDDFGLTGEESPNEETDDAILGFDVNGELEHVDTQHAEMMELSKATQAKNKLKRTQDLMDRNAAEKEASLTRGTRLSPAKTAAAATVSTSAAKKQAKRAAAKATKEAKDAAAAMDTGSGIGQSQATANMLGRLQSMAPATAPPAVPPT